MYIFNAIIIGAIDKTEFVNDAHLRVTCFPFVFELDIIHVVIIRHLNMESFTNIT